MEQHLIVEKASPKARVTDCAREGEGVEKQTVRSQVEPWIDGWSPQSKGQTSHGAVTSTMNKEDFARGEFKQSQTLPESLNSSSSEGKFPHV
jgi:hypothetical protein